MFTVLQITPVCFQNEFKTTVNVCNSIDKPRNFIIWKVTYHICSKIRRLRSAQIKLSTSFYLHNQKITLNGANQCVSAVPTATECEPLCAHRVKSNECEPVLNPWFAPSVHSDRCEQWKASDNWGWLEAYTAGIGFGFESEYIVQD